MKMPDFDIQLDEEEIVLSEEFYCFNCQIKMKQIGPKKWQCGKCGSFYDDS